MVQLSSSLMGDVPVDLKKSMGDGVEGGKAFYPEQLFLETSTLDEYAK